MGGTREVPADTRRTVAEALRAAILRGEFVPRQRLVEADLCERFGTSRFIVRAVLQDLAAQGLVEFQRNRGARVREISLAEAIEITEVRKVLESLEAARAAERVTPAEAVVLQSIVADMHAAVSLAELLRYSELNARLHATIRDIAAHETSARLLRQLRDQTVRHQFTLSLVPGRPAVSLPQHEAIVAAVTAHDAAAAERAMHDHLQSVIEALRALPAMRGGAIYADLNTASSALKAHLASRAAAAGVGFADVAVMAPVPGNGLRTPMLAAGPAAAEFAGYFGRIGASVEVLPGPAGAAAARKLVRSVFYKGLAAAVTEALRAARAAGCEQWLRDNISRELAGASAATLDRLEQGSVRHALRRIDEMAAAGEQLRRLGVPPRVASASEQWLRQLAEEQGAAGAQRSSASSSP